MIMNKLKSTCLLLILCIGFILFYSNGNVYAENELPEIGVTGKNEIQYNYLMKNPQK